MLCYISVIGDIRNSKSIKGRTEVQNKLNFVLERINHDYKDFIKLNFSITLGDEFQALLRSDANVLEIIYKIKVLLPEIEIRFGIGIGELSTNIINHISSLGTDGPVWWNAREMIQDIKDKHESTTREQSSMKIKGFGNSEIEELINHNFVLIDNIEKKFTKIQRDTIDNVIEEYGLNLNFSQTEMSKKLERSLPSFNKTINSAKYYDYIKTFNLINKLIQKEFNKDA